MFNLLFQSLTPESLLIAPNNRLAARLRYEYDRYCNSSKTELAIFTYTSWLEHCWKSWSSQQNSPTPILLTPFQEGLIWEKILSTHYPHLASSRAFIRTAQDAWELLQNWQISFNELAAEYQEDTPFLACLKEYATLCKEQNYLDYARLSDFFAQLIVNSNIPLPPHMVWIGFVEESPKMQRLFNLLNQHTRIEFYQQQINSSQVHKIALTDTESEIYTMARWAKQQADESDGNFIGCVVPELNTLRPTLERIFSEVFSVSPKANFNLSSGVSLSETPIVHTALAALQLQYRTLHIRDTGYLLRSPFLGGSLQEWQERCLLDAKLRDLGLETFALNYLLKNSLQNCPLFNQHLQDYAQLISKDELLPSQWEKIFSQQLKALGWPGERSLSSEEYQAVQTWDKIATQFSQLDAITGQIKSFQAYHYLYQLAQQTVFQPQSREAAVQIVGIVEAFGMPFTHLWVMGLENRSWPATPHPNPLLPFGLQRKLKMPYASAHEQLEFSKRMTEQFTRYSQQVIFSYPQSENDQALYPSPLLNSFKLVTQEALLLADFQIPGFSFLASTPLETLIDLQAPAFREHEKLRGGSHIFKYQAACPFRAFAELRLQAKPLAQPQPGLTAKMRGLLLHKSLELIWRTIKDQKQLLQLTEIDLISIIELYINQAIQFLNYQQRLSAQLLLLEKQRLTKLLFNWLNLEKEREPFTVVALEKEYDFLFEGYTIKLQIDRIDQLDDGSYVIIDYKTGKPTVNDWFGDRPNEPQLPLYAIINPKQTQALLFAQLNSAEIKFKGVHANQTTLPGSIHFANVKNDKIAINWQEQISNWQATMQQLFNDFITGNAKIDPKLQKKTCEFCQLQIMCRIHEHQQ